MMIAKADVVDGLRRILARTSRPLGRERLRRRVSKLIGRKVWKDELEDARGYLKGIGEVRYERNQGIRLTSEKERNPDGTVLVFHEDVTAPLFDAIKGGSL